MGHALAFDVTDAGVLGIGEGGKLVGPSPGFAVADGETLLVGEEAFRSARLRPRFVMSRFWERLDTEPLGRPFPRGLTAADLVHAHLEGLWEKAGKGVDEVVLAVPGNLGSEALGRLLGIAHALEMPVAGLVDTAVAATTGGFPGERLLFVDVHLHRATVSELRQGEEIVRDRVVTIDRWGLDELHDTLARRIAERFVLGTRYDPLHAAETEQSLHDHLPSWIDRFRDNERVSLLLGGEGRDHEVEVSRAEIEEWTRMYAEELAQKVSLLKRPGEPTTLLVSARAARVPGLVGRLSSMRGNEVVLVPEQAAAAGALREREALRPGGEGVRFLTRLARRERSPDDRSVGGGALIRPPAVDPAPPVGTRHRPTHLLLGHLARPLTAEALVVGTAPPEGSRGLRLDGETTGISRAHCRFFEAGGEVVLEDSSSYGTFVNGERVVERVVVVAGDRVRVGSPGVELLLILIEGKD